MISAISPMNSSASSSAAYAVVSAGKQAQSGSVPASSPNSVASASSSEKGSAANDSQTDAAAGGTVDSAASDKSEGESKSSTAGSEGLTQDEQGEVVQLKQRDQEVRTHEQAHQSAGAGLTGSASYTYTTGPDGKRYAVGGEVSIDTSPKRNDPSGTIQKMQQVIAAALAPADPSGQDRAVAAQASSAMATARMELVQERSVQERALPGSTVDVVA